MLSLPEGRKLPRSPQYKTRPKKSPERNKKDNKSAPILIGNDAKVKRAIRSLTGVVDASSGKIFSNAQGNATKPNPTNRSDSDNDRPNLSTYMRLANKSYKVKSALGNIVQPGKVFVNDIIQKVNKYVKFGEAHKEEKEIFVPDNVSTGRSSNFADVPNRIDKIRQPNDISKIKYSQKGVQDAKTQYDIPYPSKLDAYCTTFDVSKSMQDAYDRNKSLYLQKKSKLTLHKHATPKTFDPKYPFSKYANEQLDVEMPAKIVSITKMQPKPKTVKHKLSRIPINIASNRPLRIKSGDASTNISMSKIKPQVRPVSAIVAMALNKSITTDGVITKPILNPVVPNKNFIPKNVKRQKALKYNNASDNPVALPRTSIPRPTASKIKRPKTTQSITSKRTIHSPKKSDKTNKIKRRPKTKEGNKSAKNQDSFTRPVHCKDMKTFTLEAHAKQLQDLLLDKEEEKKQYSFKERIEKLRQTNEQTKKDIKRLLQLNTEERKLMTHHSDYTRSTTFLSK